MLRELIVKDLALIADLRLELGVGFNVVSGETGAGKSLLQRALAAVVGYRLGADSIRAGAAQASVEAIFELEDAPEARRAVERLGLSPVPDALRITRTIPRVGRGRILVEGRAVHAASLAALGEALVHLQGQHESLRLAEPGTQLEILDAAAGTTALATLYRDAWRRLGECIDRLEGLERDATERARRLELARYDFEELERAALETADEIDKLGEERLRLRNLQRLTAGVEEILDRLDQGEYAALSAVEMAMRRCTDLGAVDPALADVAASLEQAATPLAEAVRSLQRYARSLDVDPSQLDQIEERLALLSRLLRKHGCSDLAGLLARREALGRQIRTSEEDAADPEALRRELATVAGEAWRLADQLSEQRHLGATAFVEAVEAELRQLGMPDARFSVEFDDLVPSCGGVAATALVREGCGLGPDGRETVEFHLAANPGEGARPLARVASGGELSRLMLALRHVAGGALVPTLVFDEVDTGIGGTAAEIVGRRLQALGRKHQILCITHLAQIAAFADQHYAVVKERRGERTHTAVRRVEGEERVAELGRMLGGADPGEEGLRHAREMIRRARELRSNSPSMARQARVAQRSS